MKLEIAFVIVGLTTVIATVQDGVWKQLQMSELVNVKVKFKKANTASAFDRFHRLKLTSREVILDAQYAILKEHADAIQSDVNSMLKMTARSGKQHSVDQLWISAELIVRHVDRETIEQLRDHPDVESVIAETFIQLKETEEGPSFAIEDDNGTFPIQWGVANIGAPDVWNRSQGENIVIGNIGSGARHTHIFLASSYRGNDKEDEDDDEDDDVDDDDYDDDDYEDDYEDEKIHDYNWLSPFHYTAVPFDANGHGTHCIGTHSGMYGIGVAPKSRWISCKGCTGSECSRFELESCGHFMACPTTTYGTDANCSKAPHIVSNSWGGFGDDGWYNDILTAWRNAGINAVFSIGDSGTACRTLDSPGDQPLAFGVGSITSANTLSPFSSVGPGPAGALKPNIVAPGTSIVSASHLSDVGLSTKSGTDMATPHVAGLLALVRSAHPELTPEQAESAVTRGALPHSPEGRTCDGFTESFVPNHYVGYGRVNAVNSV